MPFCYTLSACEQARSAQCCNAEAPSHRLRWPVSSGIPSGKDAAAMPQKDRTGERFTRWVLLGKDSKKDRWLCQCDCGEVRSIAISNLVSGRSQSCGCLNAEQSRIRMSQYHEEQGILSQEERAAHQKSSAQRYRETHLEERRARARHQYRCVYCGKRAKGKLTQDHIPPLSKGGSHTASNIVPACCSCNSRKAAGAVLIPVQPLLLTLAPPKPPPPEARP